jgi:hypothetical protein
MPSIVVENLTIDIPVLSIRARSLRTIAVAKARAIGGRIVDRGTHVSVVRALETRSASRSEGATALA